MKQIKYPFLATWGDNFFAPGTDIVTMDFFSEENQYTDEDREAIGKLKVGETWVSRHYSDHTVQAMAPIVYMTYRMPGSDEEEVVRLGFDRYWKDDSLAIQLYDSRGYEFLTVTACVDGSHLAANEIVVKNYSENEGMANELIRNQIVKPLHNRGDITFPVYQLENDVYQAALASFSNIELSKQNEAVNVQVDTPANEQLRKSLAHILEMATSHIEDIESGIEEGIYSSEENQDLYDKKASLEVVKEHLGVLENTLRAAAMPKAHVVVQIHAGSVVGALSDTPVELLVIDEDIDQRSDSVQVCLLDGEKVGAVVTAEDVEVNTAWVSEQFGTYSSYGFNNVTRVPVAHWDSQEYGGTGSIGKPFTLDVTDRRAHGQLLIDLGSVEGELDTGNMYMTIEVNSLHGSRDEVPCAHIHFDESNLACSLFRNGEDYLIRPETGVEVIETKLPDGSNGWLVHSVK